ncbi:vesicle-associated membrane protein 4-like [Anneissia japonica]|uniref:vesicle-associated membrane protein 4-like n=1 Tax=Anneissia japonica TaxID=1529436 RepID=UPI0014257D40|nr:vesicle-associated membrane protein 4-like [Anneissia japonica]XP_033098975.1 vesicle-associated membrane protein 4-like [Anneissia japonica]XP_033098976.1 vesicle-associated membrane protein 4-like [Anneissia japonica]XP_033098977.1 vesicle-associated membrane protein 4-like [Anneissia japonica]
MPPKFKRHLKESDMLGSHHVERENLLDYQDDDDDDDDFFLKKSPLPNSAKAKTDNNIQRAQRGVDEVVDVMRDNVAKVLDRGEQLEDLQDKSDNLAMSSMAFRVSAKGLRSHFWWQECKTRLVILVIVCIVLLVIFLPLFLKKS